MRARAVIPVTLAYNVSPVDGCIQQMCHRPLQVRAMDETGFIPRSVRDSTRVYESIQLNLMSLNEVQSAWLRSRAR